MASARGPEKEKFNEAEQENRIFQDNKHGKRNNLARFMNIREEEKKPSKKEKNQQLRRPLRKSWQLRLVQWITGKRLSRWVRCFLGSEIGHDQQISSSLPRDMWIEVEP